MAKTDGLIWGDYTYGTATSPLEKDMRKPNSDLDKNAFLQLLITQMKYQDPLNPMDDKEFVAQMAQFSALEQMQNLNATALNAQAYSMIGKTIFANVRNEAGNSSKEVYGVVDSVYVENNKAYLMVGKDKVPLESVTDVFSDGAIDVLSNMSMNSFYSQNMAMIGKTIQALTVDKDKNVTGYVEGKVDYVKLAGGVPILVVGNKEVLPGEMISVSDDKLLLDKTITGTYAIDNENTAEVTGKITDVIFKDNKGYLIVGGKEILIDKIDRVTEAVRRVGQTITHGDTTGKIDSVLVKEGKVYYRVGDKEILFDSTIK